MRRNKTWIRQKKKKNQAIGITFHQSALWFSRKYAVSGWMLLPLRHSLTLDISAPTLAAQSWTGVNKGKLLCISEHSGRIYEAMKITFSQEWGGLPMEGISNIYGNAQRSTLNAAVSSDQVYCGTWFKTHSLCNFDAREYLITCFHMAVCAWNKGFCGGIITRLFRADGAPCLRLQSN